MEPTNLSWDPMGMLWHLLSVLLFQVEPSGYCAGETAAFIMGLSTVLAQGPEELGKHLGEGGEMLSTARR